MAIETEIFQEKAFWVMTLFGSIALSITANLLTPITRRLLSRFSSAQRFKAERKRERNEIIVDFIRNDKSRVYILKLDVLHQLLWSILIQGFAISAVVAIDSFVGKLIGLGLTIINIRFMKDTISLFSKIKEAESVEFEELNERLSAHEAKRNKAKQGDR